MFSQTNYFFDEAFFPQNFLNSVLWTHNLFGTKKSWIQNFGTKIGFSTWLKLGRFQLAVWSLVVSLAQFVSLSVALLVKLVCFQNKTYSWAVIIENPVICVDKEINLLINLISIISSKRFVQIEIPS